MPIRLPSKRLCLWLPVSINVSFDQSGSYYRDSQPVQVQVLRSVCWVLSHKGEPIAFVLRWRQGNTTKKKGQEKVRARGRDTCYLTLSDMVWLVYPCTHNSCDCFTGTFNILSQMGEGLMSTLSSMRICRQLMTVWESTHEAPPLSGKLRAVNCWERGDIFLVV